MNAGAAAEIALEVEDTMLTSAQNPDGTVYTFELLLEVIEPLRLVTELSCGPPKKVDIVRHPVRAT